MVVGESSRVELFRTLDRRGRVGIERRRRRRRIFHDEENMGSCVECWMLRAVRHWVNCDAEIFLRIDRSLETDTMEFRPFLFFNLLLVRKFYEAGRRTIRV